MRSVWTGVLLLLLAGCDQRKPQMSDAQMQKLRAEVPYLTDACLEKVRWGGKEALFTSEDCAEPERLPATRWRGLWRNDFEGSLFCPAPARECRNVLSVHPGNQIWLELEPRPAALKNALPGGLYAVEFIGRRTARGSPYEGQGYAQDIVVDRMISIKQIEAPPKE